MPATSTSATHAVGVRTTTLWRTPESPRPIDAPMLAADPDPRAWAAAQDRVARLALDGVADTQLLLGEPVHVVEERDGWARVVAPWQPSEQDPRGYPGWVPRTHLTSPPAASDEEAVILVDTAVLREAPGGAPLLDDVSYATILPVAGQSDGSVHVQLPGGGQAWLDGDSCLVRKADRDATVDAAAVLDQARRFVGLDYLWSGMCAFGLDCSGLVHIAFRALGKVVPRDAKDQAVAASSVPLDAVEEGDLLFFAKPGEEIHHVAFATGAKHVILHAPGTGNPVEEAPLSDRRKSTLTSAGRLTA